jgi:regulator of protease activity HflC (stomatin/prohibitin superfamily)
MEFKMTNEIQMQHINRGIKVVKYAGIGLLAVILASGAFSIVPEGTRGVKLRMSEAVGVTGTGLQFKLPFFENVVPISVMADSVEIKNAEGGTKDTQPVHTSLVVRYRIAEKDVLEVYKEYSKTGDLDQYVATATVEAFKAVTSRYDATELISKRSDVSFAVQKAIQDKISKYGAEVINIDMTQFAFAADYMKAIGQKVTEEQQKLAEINKLERIKVEQQQKVVTAQAEAEAKIAEAKGKAEAVRLEAQALQSNMSILELRRIEVQKIQAERWDGKMPTTMMGNAVPMINLGGK